MNERFNTLVDMQQKLNETCPVNDDLNNIIFKDIIRECELILKMTQKQYKDQLEALRLERRQAREAIEAAKAAEPKPVDPAIEARRAEMMAARLAAQQPPPVEQISTPMTANTLGEL